MAPFSKSLKPLAAAIAVVTQSPALGASVYEVSLEGVAIDMRRTILEVPGVPSSPFPPVYQHPRLAMFGGPDWDTKASLSIDAISGAVVDFEYNIRAPGWFGFGGNRLDLRADEQIYRATDEYRAQFTGGAVFCSVTNDANDADGVLAFHCPSEPDEMRVATLDATGYLCATPSPSTLAPGANGCSEHWAGFPDGFAYPQVAKQAAQVLPANASVGGLAISLIGTNPPMYRSVDHVQNQAGIEMHEFRGARSGATFTVYHAGTLQGGDFSVTGLDLDDEQLITFETTAPGNPSVLLETRFSFSTVTDEQFVFSSERAKAVPVLTGVSLWVFCSALIALGARLLGHQEALDS